MITVLQRNGLVGTQLRNEWMYDQAGQRVPYVVTEKFVHLPMPWKLTVWNFETDDVERRRPVLAIYWNRPAANAIRIRIGWT